MLLSCSVRTSDHIFWQSTVNWNRPCHRSHRRFLTEKSLIRTRLDSLYDLFARRKYARQKHWSRQNNRKIYINLTPECTELVHIGDSPGSLSVSCEPKCLFVLVVCVWTSEHRVTGFKQHAHRRNARTNSRYIHISIIFIFWFLSF